MEILSELWVKCKWKEFKEKLKKYSQGKEQLFKKFQEKIIG